MALNGHPPSINNKKYFNKRRLTWAARSGVRQTLAKSDTSSQSQQNACGLDFQIEPRLMAALVYHRITHVEVVISDLYSIFCETRGWRSTCHGSV